jgi:hypothetical protein
MVDLQFVGEGRALVAQDPVAEFVEFLAVHMLGDLHGRHIQESAARFWLPVGDDDGHLLTPS